MVAPTSREPLLLYIAATPRTASTILVVERDAKIIAKEGIDPPCPGASPEEKVAVSSIPQEELLAAISPTKPLSQSNVLNLMRRKLPRAPPRCKNPLTRG
jgi:hypothetical protein